MASTKILKIGMVIMLFCLAGMFSVVSAGEHKKSDSALDELAYGEVQSVLEYENDLLLVLVELPLTFRITDDTEFVSSDNLVYTKNTAKTMLIGKGVRIEQHKNENGEIIADKITVVTPEEFTQIKKEQPDRVGPIQLQQKDPVKK